MLPHRHRTHARPAAAMGDAEGLVQVEMAHVATEPARAGDADEGVEVGAVDVHLAAVLVDEVADLRDALLEHPVGGRVGDHERGEVGAVLVTLASRSSTSTLPSSSQATTTTRIPAMTADAALVP